MYNAGAFLAGAIIAVMVSCNGMLQAAVGDWTAVVIIHIIGLATIGLVVGFRRKRLHLIDRSLSPFLYTAGVLGVFTTVFNNLCYAPLGAALMLALTLLGQLTCACVIDQFGLFGMEKRAFNSKKLAGFALMALGLGAMYAL